MGEEVKYMRTFKDFKTEVRHIVKMSDYEENKHKLEDVKIFQYDVFIKVIKHGSDINGAMFICVQISNMSRCTSLTGDDIIDLLPQYQNIISIINK